MPHLSNLGTVGQFKGNFDQLKELAMCHIAEEEGQARWGALLDGLRNNEERSYLVFPGFERAPAARGNHHAFEGGLVYHLLEMWACWQTIRPNFICEPYVSDSRVIRAILAHDLHKAFRTYVVVSRDPWTVEYANEKDPSNMLMDDTIKSLWLLGRFGVPMDPEQLNALCWAHGGFSDIRPKWSTVLAKVCYLLDEMSGNGIARIDARTFLNVRVPTA